MGVIKPLYNQKFLTCALCRSTRILRLAAPVISQFHFPSQNMDQSTIADFYFLECYCMLFCCNLLRYHYTHCKYSNHTVVLPQPLNSQSSQRPQPAIHH